jgi:DNA-binding CsgD family transcriptional regulator
MLWAVARARADEHGVTRRESEVWALVSEHLTNAQIAAELYISERTVESHVAALLRKVGASDRRALARRRPPVSRMTEELPALPPALALLADPDTFVGRQAERDAIRQRWRLAAAGNTIVVFVTGEPGMGKSRLVSEVAAEVDAAGGRVLLGACYEDVDEPYGPFAQAIVADAEWIGPAESQRRAGDDGDILARLSPDLRRVLRASAPHTDGGDASARAAVHDGIRRWLVAAAAAAPLLVVIEDLHWSSSTTRDAMRHLVRRAGHAPILVLVTTRDAKPDLDADLADMLADLERSPTVARVSLRGLERDDIAQLAGRAVDEADVILAETHGNPLLVTHLTSDARSGTLPVWLYRRDQSLDDAVRGVLDQAAVLGTDFDADVLAAALDAPLLTVLESLEAAEAAGLVSPVPGRRAGFAFVHAMFRSARYRALPIRRRLELHARAAGALARSGDERVLAERARHACLAVPVADAADAVTLAIEAGGADERAYAFDEAVAHYRRGLEAARAMTPPAPTVVADLTIRIGAALHHRGDLEGLPLLLDAARKAEQAGDTTALVQAAVAIPQFGAVGFIDPMPAGRAVTEAALDALGDTPSAARARLLMDLASHWLFVDVGDARALAGRAEAVARDLGDPEVLGDVLLAARHVFSHPSQIDERVRIGAELDVLGRRLDRLPMLLAALGTQAAAHFERGQLDAWIDAFERFVAVLGEHSLAFFRLQAMTFHATRAFLRGDLARAEEEARRTVPLSIGIGAGRVYAESMVVSIRRLQGRDGELVDRYARAAARSRDAWYRCSLSAAQARSGRIDDARATMAALREERFPLREIYPWSVAVTDLAEAAEVAAVPDVAAHVLDVAGPFTGRIAVSGPCPNRTFDQALAQAALAVGDASAAARYATAAVDASRRRDTPVFLARELVFLAEARRRLGDRAETVEPLVREAIAIAEPLGLDVVTGRRRALRDAELSAGRHGRERGERLDLVGHRRAEPQQQLGDLVVGPTVAGDHVDDVPQLARELVAPPLVAAQRGPLVGGPGEHVDEGASEELGVAQGVGDAVGADRVLPVTGIADQRPAVTPGAPDVSGLAAERAELTRRLGIAEPGGEVRERRADDIGDHGRPAAPDPAAAGAGEDARPTVVRRDHPGCCVRSEVPLVAVGVEPRPVAVGGGGGAGPQPLDRRADLPRHLRADPVRADDEPCADPPRAPVRVATVDPADAPVVVAHQIGDGERMADVDAGIGGGISEYRIEHGAARRVQGVDATTRLDRDGDLLTGVAERGAPDRRGAGGDHTVQHAPPVELQHTGAHERVGRERVGAVCRAVDDDHVEAGPGEQHRGRRAGGAGADDQDVVVGVVGSHRWLLARVRLVRWSATSSASRPTPSRKLERRRCWKRCPST